MVSTNKNSIEFERELALLKEPVVKIVVNELKKSGLYTEFRKHYTKWSMMMNKIPEAEFFMGREFYFSPLSPRVTRYEIDNVKLCLSYAASIINSFTWSETPEGMDKWCWINAQCALKINHYIAEELQNKDSETNKFKRKYGFSS